MSNSKRSTPPAVGSHAGLGTQFPPRGPQPSSESLSRLSRTIQPGFNQPAGLGTLFAPSDSAASLSVASQDTEDSPGEPNDADTSPVQGTGTDPGLSGQDSNNSRPASATSAPETLDGKSTWNLRIRPRNVAGQISGIRNEIPADPAACTGLLSAMVPDDSVAEYEVVNELGAGSMGIVYRARQTSLNRILAIKTLKPDIENPGHTQAAFVSEAVVTAHLVHPNIVPVHDLGHTTDGKLFYSMKQVGGTAWDKTIRENTLDDNLDILLKVCDAVAYAHSRGVINRDLKPENVMVGDFGEVLVLDWGLAVTTSRFASRNSVQVDHQGGAGTPAYMAPELAGQDIRHVGPASDIYLLGAVLFEILEGFQPHLLKETWSLSDCEAQMAIIYRAVLNNEIETDVTNEGELMQIARKAMQTQPEDRYHAVEDFQEALREYRITGTAEEIMHKVEHEGTGSYSEYQTAVALYDEALRKWPDNQRARQGDQLARRGYAQLAMKKGDLDLGLEVIAAGEADGVADRRIRKKLKSSRRVRRLIKVTWVLMTVAAIAFAGWARKAEEDLTTAVGNLEEVEKKADQVKKNADQKITQANQQVTQADEKAKKAGGKQKAAETAAMEARKAAMEAEDKQKVAQTAATKAQVALNSAKQEAETANQQAVRTKFKSLIDQVDAKIELAKNDDVPQIIKEARQLDKDHPDVISKNALKAMERKLEAAQTGADGNTAIHYDDKIKQARISADGTTRVSFRQSGGTLTAFRQQGNPKAETPFEFEFKLLEGSKLKDIAVSRDGAVICAIDQKQSWVWRWQQDRYAVQPSLLHASKESQQRCLISADAQRLYLLGTSKRIPVVIQSLTKPRENNFVTLGKNKELNGFHDAVLLPDESGLIIAARTGSCHYIPLIRENGTVKVKERKEDQTLESIYPKLAGLQKLGSDGNRFQPQKLTISQDGSLLALVEKERSIFARSAEGMFPFKIQQTDERVETKIEADIRVLAFSGDNQRVVMAIDRYLQIWDRRNGPWKLLENRDWHEQTTLGGHADDILAVAFQGATDNQLISVSRDHSRRSWNIDTYADYTRSLKQLIAPEQPATAEQPAVYPAPQQHPVRATAAAAPTMAHPVVLPRRQYLLTGVQDTAQNKSPIEKRQGRKIYSAQFSPDGRRFIVGSNDLAAHAFDSKSGEQTLTASMSTPRDLFFDPERNHFLEGHIPEIVSLLFLPPDGNLLLTFDYFGSVSVWDATDNSDGVGFERSRLLPEDPSCEMSVSPDGQWIVASGLLADNSTDVQNSADQYCAVVWKTSEILESASPTPFQVLKGQTSYQITAAAFSLDSRQVITATRRGTLVLWDVQSGQVVARTTGAHGFDAVSGNFFSAENEIISSGFDGRVFRWTVRNGQFGAPQEITRPSGDGIPDFIIRLRPRPNGSGFITSDLTKIPNSDEYQLNLRYCTRAGEWRSLPSVTRFHPIRSNNSDRGKPYRHDVSWSRDGSQVLYVHENRLLVLDSADWKVSKAYELPKDKVAVRGAFSPGDDGKSRIATFDGRFANLWDLESLERVTEFRSHGPEIHAGFSADRKYVATASDSLRLFYADEAHPENHGQPVFRLSRRVAGLRPFADVRFRPLLAPAADPGQGGLTYTLASIDHSGNVKQWEWTAGGPPPSKTVFETGEARQAVGEWMEDEQVALANSLHWSDDGQYLAAIRQGRLQLWTVTDQGLQPLTIPLPVDIPDSELALNALDFSRDGSLLTAAGVHWDALEQELVSYGFLWRVSRDGVKMVARIDATERHDIDSDDEPTVLGITAIAIDDAHEELLTGGSDATLQRWVLPTEEETLVSTEETLAYIVEQDGPDGERHAAAVTALDVDAVHGKLLSADANGKILLWPADR